MDSSGKELSLHPFRSTGLTRNLVQVAMKEEEVEIDQRRLPVDYDPATFDPPTERVWRLDEISSLTLGENAELTHIFLKKLGMKEKKAENTVYEMKLESCDWVSKIKIVKEVIFLTGLGVKEAKELVEKTPIVFKKGVSEEGGEHIMEKMEALRAKVVMDEIKAVTDDLLFVNS